MWEEEGRRKKGREEGRKRQRWRKGLTECGREEGTKDRKGSDGGMD